MSIKAGERPESSKLPTGGGSDSAPSSISVLAFFAVLAVVGVGGYFLLMKLINMSREEDCILAGRRNCALIAVPADR